MRTKSVSAKRSVSLVIASVLRALIVFVSTSASSAPPAELGEIKGKVVLVDFWASWCVPCRHSFPWMNQMQQKYGAQGLQIIGVNLDDNKSAAEKFHAEIRSRRHAGSQVRRSNHAELVRAGLVGQRHREAFRFQARRNGRVRG